jgi:hypothetical protein
MKQFLTLFFLLAFFAGKTQNSIIKQVVVAEYRTWYITNDGKIWAYNDNSKLPVQCPIGGMKADTGAGGFNYFRILDQNGYIWTSQIGISLVTTRIDKDAAGAAFDRNTYVDAYGNTALTIRTDGSVWYFGKDAYSLFYKGGVLNSATGTIMAPMQLSPAGWKFKKVLFGGDGILGLTTSGQVYKWYNQGSRTPTLIPTPRPATDIFISHLGVNGAIIPDAGAAQTSGYPYIWGATSSMWGQSGNFPTPVAMKDFWKMKAPVKEISVDWNTIHYIDIQGDMYGCGFNSFGEVGNGEEFLGRYNYPGFPGYGWDFTDYENPTGIPAQIGKGIKWQHLYSNNWFGFYKYAMDEKDSIYSWGRNKSLTLGNGLWNGYDGGAIHPNQLDVLKPTMVHPLKSIFTEYGFIPPSISVSPTQTISTSTVTLKGVAKAPLAIAVKKPSPNGIDTAGYHIVSYLWTKVSGPAGGVITSPGAATTTVTGLSKGTYVFNLLTKDDNSGMLSANATVIVTNTAPGEIVISAGSNQTIALPVNSVTLTGTASQTNGTIASYQWSQVSGPSTAAFTNAKQSQTSVTGLVKGTYQFQLLVTTALGTTAVATAQVTVNAAAVITGPPSANAGTDKTIASPASSVTLSGSGTETNGTIASYKWGQVSGPSTASIASATQASTVINSLVAGTYVFQLTVTDKSGVTASDLVNVIVTSSAAGGPPPPGYLPVPGTIQAEKYNQMTGVQTQATTDAGGGDNVGWIDAGDQMSYNVDVSEAGAYSVAFRVATPYTGAVFHLQDQSGYVLATVTVPYTGDWQVWTTINVNVNLAAGKQVLKIVSDKDFRWNFNWMQFTFLTDATVSAIPGIVQAENYDNMVGIATETTLDAGGGKDVGWIDAAGDEMRYRVNVAAAGVYTVSFRVASPYTGGAFRLVDASGKILTSVSVPYTTGWQVWTTVSATVSLAAGQQTVKIVSQNAYGWNINWMQYVSGTKAAGAALTSETSAGKTIIPEDSMGVISSAGFSLYPNPATDLVTLNIVNNYAGRFSARVISAEGKVMKNYELNKDQPAIQSTLSLSGLTPGLYIIRLQGSGWSETKKVLKK